MTTSIPIAKIVDEEQDEAAISLYKIRDKFNNLPQIIIDEAFKAALKADTPYIFFMHKQDIPTSYKSTLLKYRLEYPDVSTGEIYAITIDFSMNPIIFGTYLKNHSIKNNYQCENVLYKDNNYFCNLSTPSASMEEWKYCFPEEKSKSCTIC